MRFNNKVAVVTGGASGIGAASVRLMVAEGAQVMIGDMDDAGASAVAAELGTDRVAHRHCDVANEADVNALMSAAVEQFGRLDVLVNNAGITGMG